MVSEESSDTPRTYFKKKASLISFLRSGGIWRHRTKYGNLTSDLKQLRPEEFGNDHVTQQDVFIIAAAIKKTVWLGFPKKCSLPLSNRKKIFLTLDIFLIGFFKIFNCLTDSAWRKKTFKTIIFTAAFNQERFMFITKAIRHYLHFKENHSFRTCNNIFIPL